MPRPRSSLHFGPRRSRAKLRSLVDLDTRKLPQPIGRSEVYRTVYDSKRRFPGPTANTEPRFLIRHCRSSSHDLHQLHIERFADEQPLEIHFKFGGNYGSILNRSKCARSTGKHWFRYFLDSMVGMGNRRRRRAIGLWQTLIIRCGESDCGNLHRKPRNTMQRPDGALEVPPQARDTCKLLAQLLRYL